MKGVEKFKELCALHISIIFLIVVLFYNIEDWKVMYEGVSEFVPVRAYYVDSIDSEHATYSYKVNGIRYTEDFTTGLFSNYSENHKFIEVYYHPNNPQICSKYRTFQEAIRLNIFMIIFGLVMEVFIIFGVYKSFRRDKMKSIKYNTVVLNEEEDDLLNL